ncbi:MAG: hypothetical protein IAE91_03980 [Ignavibacteriaceae bacterium]|nr:hypothetical protein [Ignavibacteriaceae bacterium]
MMRIKILILSLFFLSQALAQVEAPLLILNRGMLWHSLSFAKSGPSYNNWSQTGPTLDWPGFDPSWIADNIGGAPSHAVSGGFWIGAKNRKDSVLSVEDWSMYGGSVTSDGTSKYTVKVFRHVYKNGENYWLKTNPKAGEEVIESVFEYNPNFLQQGDDETQLPIRVVRKAHQWSGSKAAENYIIYEYYFINISDEIKVNYPQRVVSDTMYNMYVMMNYGLQVNSRSWRVLFPQETSGARNTKVQYDNQRKMFYGENANYGFSNSNGRIENGATQGEWLAPGFTGVRLLYATPDSTGIATRVDLNKVGWSRADNSLDLQGPFTGISGFNDVKYEVVKNPRNAYRFLQFPQNLLDSSFVNNSRKWSIMTLGPWTLAPGDTVKIALAEIVDGMDYSLALDRNIGLNQIFNESYTRKFRPSADRALLTYNNGLNHPDPPAAPKFSVDYFSGAERRVANVVSWGNETEALPDPDDGTLDLAGYRIYRSNFLPMGPWQMIADVKKGESNYFDILTGKYSFLDSTVQLGTGYYYAITAYDTGKASWPINPAQVFPETGSNRVPPQESSIFANRMITPFLATLPATDNVSNVLVVPNPFVIGEGSSIPGESDRIQFVNLPNPCTIRIYTVRGDLVKTIEVGERQGQIVSWDQVTDFGQYVESGIYIFHVDSPVGKATGKFAIIR